MRRYLVVFAVVVHLVLADAVAKELAAGYLKGASSLPIIPGFFDLAYRLHPALGAWASLPQGLCQAGETQNQMRLRS